MTDLAGKTALILGATGLVGGALRRAIERRGANVIAFHRLPPGGMEIADYVIHAAGYGQPLKFLADPMNAIRVNTTTLMDMFGYLKPGGTLLFLSSSEVCIGAPSPHAEDAIGTTNPEHPRSSYIESKRCGEAIVHAMRASGVNAKIARLSLAYGPGTKADDERALNSFIRQALTRGHITLLDSGSAGRTFGYIDDIVTMLLNVLLHGTQAIYNVGGVSETTIRGLAERIGIATESSVSAPGKSNAVPGGPDAVRLDLSRYAAEFGLPDFIPLDEGLRRTIAWQREKLYPEVKG